MNRVLDKIAVITGGGSGIGRAASIALGKEGAKVVVTDINAEAGEAVAAEIRRAGHTARALYHDVGDEQSWKTVIDSALSEFGHLDVLVNNAGVGPTKSLLETSLADWHAVLRINLDGVFLGMRAGVEAMRPLPSRPRRGSASIINLSSILGIVGLSEATAYSASKGGVRLMTKSVALECAAKGWDVRVNSIHPGFIATPMVDEAVARFAALGGIDTETQRKAFADLHPLGRLGLAEEIAAAIVFLASDESSFVTGAELAVDGGYTAR
jgi:3(or 17)beta-hydroxysteroid dehydrogenase